eukprot:GFKZ01005854.1.p1 GENE.GFKZ01005854.1~~GFKZ01005854.1.p1  ORF type:complete len:732 (+),score=56.08 GFKZ01005854.1:559-2754(+)
MDRSFNFFDHPSLIRHSSSGNNSQSSPSLLPQALFQNQQQHIAANIQDRHQHQQESQQRTYQQHEHNLQNSLHHQYSHNRQIRHQSHQERSRIPQQLTQQRIQNVLPPQPHHQPLGHHQSFPQSHDQAAPSHNIQQQLHIQPVDSHAHDPVAATTEAGASHNPCSQPIQSQQLPCQRRQLHAHRYHVPQIQLQPQHHPHHHSSQPSSTQHHTPSSSQQLSLNLHHNPAHMSSPMLPTSSNSGAFPGALALSQNASHFSQPASRDSHLHQHSSHFQIHPQGNVSHQPLAQPSNPSNPFVAQPLQMQAVLPSHQGSNTASFGSLGNLQNSALPGNSADDPSGPSSQFGSQSGDTLGGISPWDSSHQHGTIASQGVSANQTQPQHLLPLPVVGDTRAINGANGTPQNQAFGSHGGTVQNSYGGTLSNGISVLGSSLNSNAVVSGLVPLTGQVGQTPPSAGKDPLKPTSTSLSASGDFSTAEMPTKKAKLGTRKGHIGKGNGSRSAPPLRGPITSPVSTATLPTAKKQLAANLVSNSHQNQISKIDRVGNSKGKSCTFVVDEDVSHSAGVTATASLAISASVAPRTEIAQSMGGLVAKAHLRGAQSQLKSARASDSFSEWTGKKQNTGRGKKNRRNPDGTASTPVPVHLRNPKKGRARVFRNCQKCKSENHIRRSNCVTCQAPLPAGKRRRDGNPSYSRKGSLASVAPNTQGISHDSASRSDRKGDVAMSTASGS